MGHKPFDDTDLAILDAIQKEARPSLRRISSRVYLSHTNVSRRLRKLETLGYVKLIPRKAWGVYLTPGAEALLDVEDQMRGLGAMLKAFEKVFG